MRLRLATSSIAALLVCCLPAAADPELVLAENGEAALHLQAPSDTSETEIFAVQELARYLQEITGASFDVSAKKDGPCIQFKRVGHNEASAQFPAESFRISVLRNGIVLESADARGALFGVYELLHRLGCRWLAPELKFYQGHAQHVPRLRRLVLPIGPGPVESPGLKYRKLYVEEGLSHTTETLLATIDWMPKRGFNTLVVPLNYAGHGRVKWDNWREALTPELRCRGIQIEVGGHGYENYLNASMDGGRLFAEHPEWFGLTEAGQRSKSARIVFCTSNSEARSYFIKNVKSYLKAHPEIEIFDFWPPDGAKWCACANCTALGTPSDRQAILLKEVSAAVHHDRPALQFETIAYAACIAPPEKEKLDAALLVDFCPIGQSFEFQINDPASAKNTAYVTDLTKWLKSFSGPVSIYSYYRKYAWRSLPNLLPHYMQKDLQFYRAAGVRGVSSYAEPGDWAAYELNHYVLGGLAWNPNADVEAMIAEFAQARFGSEEKLAREACRVLEDYVRHFCSLPGTTLKTPAQYSEALERVDQITGKLAHALPRADAATRLALERLVLCFGYVRGDIWLQQARVQSTDLTLRKTKLNELSSLLEQNADQGVFIPSRGKDKQFNRYGLQPE